MNLFEISVETVDTHEVGVVDHIETFIVVSNAFQLNNDIYLWINKGLNLHHYSYRFQIRQPQRVFYVKRGFN